MFTIETSLVFYKFYKGLLIGFLGGFVHIFFSLFSFYYIVFFSNTARTRLHLALGDKLKSF